MADIFDKTLHEQRCYLTTNVTEEGLCAAFQDARDPDCNDIPTVYDGDHDVPLVVLILDKAS